jgi:hypothetical protein
MVGEVITQNFGTASLTAATWSSQGFTCPAGDWEFSGVSNFSQSGATSSFACGIGLTPNAQPPLIAQISSSASNLGGTSLSPPLFRASFATPTAVYMSSWSNFSSGSNSTTGTINARRVR